MKRILLFLLFVITAISGSAQKIHTVDSKYDADINVQIVDKKYDADLVVHKVDSKYDAEGNKGLWYFVDSKYDADVVVQFVDEKYDADLRIHYTDSTQSKYDAGWEEPSKKHLLE